MTFSKDMAPLPSNFFPIFWQNQFRTTIPIPTARDLPTIRGKTAIVTGSNTGLGYDASRQLLGLGLAHLIVAVRSRARGEEAAAELRKAGSKEARVDVWELDMASYESIRAFVGRCERELERIDVVILNAGLLNLKFATVPATGHEMVVQINHISTSLLTILLLPILQSKKRSSTDPVRLTIVNSLTAHLAKFANRNQRPLLPSFDDTSITPWDPQERYGVSKLLNQLFLVKLSERVPSDDIILNMVDPGLTKGTGLAREASGLVRAAIKVFNGVAGRPVERGAATYVHAVGELGRESHGCFLMNSKNAP
jgi:NAD(P)-dependent dehydrogenase (short-subunit alcohol dehydrogenase family)